MQDVKQQIELLDRVWESQLAYSKSRANLADACDAMAKALSLMQNALQEVNTKARVLGGIVVEIPDETLLAMPEQDRARALADKQLALDEIDTWMKATKVVHKTMEPAAWALAEASVILDNADHGKSPA